MEKQIQAIYQGKNIHVSTGMPIGLSREAIQLQGIAGSPRTPSLKARVAETRRRLFNLMATTLSSGHPWAAK